MEDDMPLPVIEDVPEPAEAMEDLGVA